MSLSAERKPFQGVLQILRFNWPQYAAAAVVIAGSLLLLLWVHSSWRFALLVAVVPAAFWSVSSLIVSYCVYDRSPLYRMQWLRQALGRAPACWLNIHCGFDETSALLLAEFPHGVGQVVNIYDPATMTEGSIAKAQQRSGSAAAAATRRYYALGFEAGRFDTVFLIFAAHELRRHGQRVELLREAGRLLTPQGDLLLIEHGRDAWNFLAFGPGFLHFYSPAAWKAAISDAGLALNHTFRMTPFVTAYRIGRCA